ncbi:MAG: hypothetical protein RL483_1304 [Pseudomonadota bacterium]
MTQTSSPLMNRAELQAEMARLSRAKIWILVLFAISLLGAVFTFALGVRQPGLLQLLSIESSNVQREVSTAAKPADARVSSDQLIADLRARLQKRDWFDQGFQMGISAAATGLSGLPQAEAKLVIEPLKRLQDLAPKLLTIGQAVPGALSQVEALAGPGRVLEPSKVPAYSPFLEVSKALGQMRPLLATMKTTKAIDKPDGLRQALKALQAGRQRIDEDQFKSAMTPRRVGIRDQVDELVVLKRATEWESAIFSANAVAEEVLARLVGLESALANQQAVHLRTSDKTNQFDLWTLTFLSGFVTVLAFVAGAFLVLTADRELRNQIEQARLVPSGVSGDAVVEPALGASGNGGSASASSAAVGQVVSEEVRLAHERAKQTLQLAGEQITFVLLAAKQIGDLGRQLSEAIRKLSDGLSEIRQATEGTAAPDVASVLEPARLRLQEALASLVSLKEQGLQLSVMASGSDAPRGMADLCDRFSENIDYIELQARKLEKSMAEQQQALQPQATEQPPGWSRLQTDAEALLLVTRQWVSQIGRLNEALAELSGTLQAPSP